MIHAVAVLAGALLVAQTQAPQTLAGIELGASAKDVVAAHRGAPVAGVRWGPTWAWNGGAIGTVRVTADDDGNVGIVDVVLGRGSTAIDLPGATAFPVTGDHAKYSDMSSFIDSDTCAAGATGGSCYAYTLDDGELVLQFAALGTLHEALWGDRSLLKSLDIVQPGVSL